MLFKQHEGEAHLEAIREFFQGTGSSSSSGPKIGSTQSVSGKVQSGLGAATSAAISDLSARIILFLKDNSPSVTNMIQAAKTGAIDLTSAIGSAAKKVMDWFTRGDVSFPTIRRGSMDTAATNRLRASLSARGYKVAPSGSFDASLESIVKTFQRNNPPLIIDGIVGPKTWEKLTSPLVPVLPSKQVASVPVSVPIIVKDPVIDKPIIKDVQRKLNALSVVSPPLVEDGILGPKTNAALRLYQEANGLIVSGAIDSNTYASLSNAKTVSEGVPRDLSNSEAVADNDLPKRAGSQAADRAMSEVPTGGSFSNKAKTISSRMGRPQDISSLLLKDSYNAGILDMILSRFQAEPFSFSFFAILTPFVPAIIKSLAYHESSINNKAVGPKYKEVSMFQFYPPTLDALRNKYSLPVFDVDDPDLIATYLRSFFKDMDGFAPAAFSKDIFGGITGGSSSFPWITSRYKPLAELSPLYRTLFGFFMMYNAWVTESSWVKSSEEWRISEALTRVLTTTGQIMG